jgi:DNA topoisomerase-3
MKAAPAAKKLKRPKKPVAAKKQKRTPAPEPPDRLEEALRAWRLAEAKRRNVPAFRIMGDQALRSIASKRPATAQELLAIPGIGISIVEKYGAQIYRILHEGHG